jgi:uncharacterized protein (TIGR02271 family)
MRKNSKHSTIVGVFQDQHQARQAVDELRRAGFREDQIGVVGPDGTTTGGTKVGSDEGTSTAVGAATGVAAGAGVGALWALGIAANVLPAIGPVISGGILASVLASAAGAAAAGGIVGALVGFGLSEEDAHYYEGELKAGRTLVTVQADRREDEARAILERFGGYGRHSGATTTGTTKKTRTSSRTRTKKGTSTGVETEGQTVEVREEQLRTRKRPVKTGEVKVRKEVRTEHQTIDVPVEREEVVIEHRPVGRRGASGSPVGMAEEIRIPVREEQVDVEKESVVKEEVKVGKRKVRGTETVSGNVHKEQVKVEREGDVEVHDGTDANPAKKK